MKEENQQNRDLRKRRRKNIYWLGMGIVFIILAVLLLFRWGYKKEKMPLAPLKEEREVNLYFSDQEARYLVGEKRRIFTSKEIVEQARSIILELIKGPKGDLVKTIPEQVSLRGIWLDQEGQIYVDFSQELSRNHPGGSSAEIYTVYSIVNSLILNFPQVKKVQILIEGNKIDTLAGHIYTRKPFKANLKLLKPISPG